jgi:hypothetical protein
MILYQSQTILGIILPRMNVFYAYSIYYNLLIAQTEIKS